ncbi:hypothetical protein B0G84_5019 [Paraburkholderia sp. BL8N3]|nr:hypothetical protein B0G84_5019 [Paraburkholderia sp. BL8N3]
MFYSDYAPVKRHVSTVIAIFSRHYSAYRGRALARVVDYGEVVWC